MTATIAFLPLTAPVLLIIAAVLGHQQQRQPPRRALMAAQLAGAASLLIALISILPVILHGPLSSPLLGAAGIGLSLRLDAISLTLFALVAFVGLIVLRYSRTYLAGHPRQGPFLGDLCLTLAAVMLLVLAGNLTQLVAAWIGTSLALQRLLLFQNERPRARIAARKKAITARLSDICLILAAILLARAFGSTDIGHILAAADTAVAPAGILPAAILLSVAAMLKSAQFPAHGWLTEVMETPTPVSALLHAGIINAGGFLIIRFADVMLLAPGAMHLLAIVGGATALLASVVMLTQTSVKVSLAWSTIAQMGFMLFECGLGAFAIALLHIVAHSLYKAHAFLAAGSIVDIARSSWVPVQPGGHPLRRLLLGMGLAAGVFLALASALGLRPSTHPVDIGLGLILVLGTSHLLCQALAGGAERGVLLRSLFSTALVSLAYLVLKRAVGGLTAATVPAVPDPGPIGLSILIATCAAFALVVALQALLPSLAGRPLWQRAQIHLRNGLYCNLLFDKAIGALRRPAQESC